MHLEALEFVFSSKDFQLKFWNLATHSCFYTIAENVTEVGSFGTLTECWR